MQLWNLKALFEQRIKSSSSGNINAADLQRAGRIILAQNAANS